MTNTYDLRPVATSNLANTTTGHSLANEWPLYSIPKNRIAYQLYYYLLSLSAKDHYTNRAYISDKYWVKKKAAEDIQCSPRSITNNLTTLENVGLIQRDETRKAYVFPEHTYEALISHNTIKLFLSLEGQIDSVEALRIFSII